MNNAHTTYQPPTHTGLTILFEDEHLLVADKPAGLLSVPGNSPEKQDCMISRLQVAYPETLVVHRLDMSTSGLLLFARNKAMHRSLSIMFAERMVDKTYIAVVDGVMNMKHGEINQPLMADWPNRPRQKIDAQGKPSITRYHVLAQDKHTQTTRVKLTPITGRSHQLRVHMMSLGHPILGDEFYATDTAFHKAKRLLLHATTLCFEHPITQQPILVESPPPF